MMIDQSLVNTTNSFDVEVEEGNQLRWQFREPREAGWALGSTLAG